MCVCACGCVCERERERGRERESYVDRIAKSNVAVMGPRDVIKKNDANLSNEGPEMATDELMNFGEKYFDSEVPPWSTGPEAPFPKFSID